MAAALEQTGSRTSDNEGGPSSGMVSSDQRSQDRGTANQNEGSDPRMMEGEKGCLLLDSFFLLQSTPGSHQQKDRQQTSECECGMWS